MTRKEAAPLTNRQVKLRLMGEKGFSRERSRDFSLLWEGRPVLQRRPMTLKEFFGGYSIDDLKEFLGGRRSWIPLTKYRKKIIRDELSERLSREAIHTIEGYAS
jgi:hypothetical protein